MKLIVSGWDFPPLSLLVWKHSVYLKNPRNRFLKIANNNDVAKNNRALLQFLANGNSQVTRAREILFL